jgi:hypothetical protein
VEGSGRIRIGDDARKPRDTSVRIIGVSGGSWNRAFPESEFETSSRDPTSSVLSCIKRLVQRTSDVLGGHDEIQPLVLEGIGES